jgi:hypothetical protein
MTGQSFGRRVKRIDELAQDLPPARDLWPAIAKAIAAEQVAVTPVSGGARRAFWRPASSMAAAVALVAVGVWIGRAMTLPAGGPTIAGTQDTTIQDANRIQTALQRDEKYHQQRDALLVDVEKRLKAMPPAERDKVSASLATLRRSIGEIEASLGRDPANALLQELLVSSCQEEMRALTAVRDAGSQET